MITNCNYVSMLRPMDLLVESTTGVPGLVEFLNIENI